MLLKGNEQCYYSLASFSQSPFPSFCRPQGSAEVWKSSAVWNALNKKSATALFAAERRAERRENHGKYMLRRIPQISGSGRKASCCGTVNGAEPVSACCAQEQTAEESCGGRTRYCSVRREMGRRQGCNTVGEVPLAATKLTFADRPGLLEMPLVDRQNELQVEPGLYGVGRTDASSPVLVTSNYKMTFDRPARAARRTEPLDCRIGHGRRQRLVRRRKGTFGTEEVIRRITSVQLSKIVVAPHADPSAA